MPFRFFILLTLLFALSCSKPGKQKAKRVNRIVNCIYKPEDTTLVKIDSLVNKHDYSELNSIYFDSGFNTEERVFLSNLMLKQYKYKFDYDSISHYISLNDSILSSNKDVDISLKIDFYKKKSDFFLKKGRLDSSVYYLKKIAGKDDFSKNSICYEKIKAFSDIGVALTYYGGSLDSARYYLEKQEKLFTKNSVFSKLKYKNYYTQATIYRRLHKYQLSLTYLDMALNIMTNEIKNKLSIALAYDLKSNVLYEYEKYNRSVKYSKKAIELGEQINNISAHYMKNFYIGIINALTQLDSIKQANRYINKLLSLSKDDNNTKALSYKLKGILSFKSNKFDKADRFFKKAFDLYNSTKNPNYYHLAETCYLYSDKLRVDGNYDKAIYYGNHCIKAFLKYNNNDLNAFYSDPVLITYLSNIAFIYSDKAKVENILVSHKYALEKYALVDSLISGFYNSVDQDVTLINQQSLDLYYYHYFDFCYSLYNKTRDKKYFTMAIDILSKYKGVALLKERLAYNNFNSEIKKLKQKIEKIRFTLNEKKTKSDSINSLLNRELKRLENYKLPLQTGLYNINTLEKIEEYCRLNNQILIDYFFPFGDFDTNEGYVFVTNGDLSKIFPIEDISDILVQTDSTYQMLSEFSAKESILTVKSAYLYDKLLFFINDFKKQKTNSLLIIPDRNLYNIPFELLVTDMSSNKMLIEDFDISYSFSIKNLLLYSGVTEKTNTVLAFSYSDSRTISDWNIDSLTELAGGFREVQGIKKMFKDKCMVFSGMESTKKNFFDYAKDYSIIHLALHGKADENSRFRSCIYFRDGKKISPLYPYELMNHDINPDLMVLSSCQSARGKAYNQESMYSIAKSFYASGARKVISSLWDLDDDASNSIIDSFYQTIRNENSTQYSKALRKAKLSYLETIRNNNQKRSYIGSLVLYK